MSVYIIICLLAFLLSCICGLLIIPQIMNFCKEKQLYDIPNMRKVHKNAIPRLGGISFLPSILASTIVALLVWAYAYNGKKIDISPWTIFFAIGLGIIYAMGLIDDVFGMKARVKFFIQIIASCLLPLSWLYINNLYGFLGIYEIPYWIGAPLTVFLLVFIMNAMNLIDGIDGLAASLSFIALCGFLHSFFLEQLWVYCILIAGLIGVLIPFLYYNIFGKIENNRKIFMGDSGSLTIGYILGVLFVKFCMYNPNVMGYRRESMFLSFTLLIVPTFDVCRIIITRILHGHKIFQPDKNHIHHKLMRAGLSQHQTLLAIISLAIFYIVFNAVFYDFISITLLVLIDIILYICLHLFVINRYIKKKNEQPFQEY